MPAGRERRSGLDRRTSSRSLSNTQSLPKASTCVMCEVPILHPAILSHFPLRQLTSRTDHPRRLSRPTCVSTGGPGFTSMQLKGSDNHLPSPDQDLLSLVSCLLSLSCPSVRPGQRHGVRRQSDDFCRSHIIIPSRPSLPLPFGLFSFHSRPLNRRPFNYSSVTVTQTSSDKAAQSSASGSFFFLLLS